MFTYNKGMRIQCVYEGHESKGQIFEVERVERVKHDVSVTGQEYTTVIETDSIVTVEGASFARFEVIPLGVVPMSVFELYQYLKYNSVERRYFLHPNGEEIILKHDVLYLRPRGKARDKRWTFDSQVVTEREFTVDVEVGV